MAEATSEIWVPVLPSMRGFGPALVKQGSAQAASGGKTLGGTMGKAMVAGFAAAAAGVAAAGVMLYKTGEIFDDMSDTIRVGTGATGQALKDLEDVAKSVGQNVPVEFEKIGPVVADLNTRLGLSGETLDVVARQYLEAGRILGEDVDIQKTSAAFTSFGIEGEAVSGAMDHLFRVSQATGVGMNELAEGVARNGPAVQELGFNFEESAALIGNLDKAGLNSSKMMAGLGQSLVRLAKDGEEPREAFDRVTGEIDGFIANGDRAGAIDLAGKVFGTKNAPQFIKAIEDGTLSMANLGEVAGMTEDTILGAGEETMDFAEQWQMFKNNVLVWLEPMGARVFGGLSNLMADVVDGVTLFGEAWATNGSKITATGLPGFMQRLGGYARTAFDYFQNTVVPVLARMGGYIAGTMVPGLRDFGTWLNSNKNTLGIVAGVITAVVLPALVRMGIASLVSGAQAVSGWVMQRVAAVQTGVAYVVQSIRIIGTWVAMGLAAVASGAQTAYVWLLYRIEAIKAAAVMVAQRARIVGAWIAMSAAAVVSGARTAVVWAVQVVAAAARGAARFVLSAARVVGGWVLMSLQSLLHAGRMAAAWFIALGPIGWVTAAVIAIAALVIANWDKISAWTKKAWSAVMNWIVGAWRNIRDRTMQILGAIVTWITGRFNSIRDTTARIWNGVRDKISSIWNGIKNTLKSVWDNGIRPVFNAFSNFIKDTVVGRIEKGIDMIKSAWEKVANIFRKPINWVINTVWNGGIKKAFDAVSKAVGSDTRLAEVKSIPAFAKGGDMQDGWKLVGEKGPELINTGPGWVARADQTKRLLNGDVAEGQHVHPMGGGWVSKVWDSVKDAASSALSWVRGGLASAAESLLKPLISSATGQMAKFGSMGALGGGLIDNGVDRILEWIRGEDTVESSGGHEYDGPMQMGGAYRPGRGPITSWYGMRGGRLHGGVDIAGPRGAPTFAAWDGVVHSIQNYAQGSGLSVNLSHGGGKYSHYGHNDYGGIPVRAGQSVKAGQRIGNMGMTGRTTGPHVHFETWQGGLWNRRNPNALFRDGGGPIYPGMNMVLNKTPHLERTFNDPQFQNLNRMAELAVNGGGAGGRDIAVTFNGVDMDQSYKLAQDFRRTTRQLERVGY